MPNAAIALLLAAISAIELAVGASHSPAAEAELVAASAIVCLAIATQRRAPAAATIGGGLGCFVPGYLIGGRWGDWLPDAISVGELVLAFSAGWRLRGPLSIAGLVATSLGFTGGYLGGHTFVIVLVFVIPAWITGTVMRSRDKVAAQLVERAKDFEDERAAFAREAVRYERARIARDLHDVVAHEVSLIVVQAGSARGSLASNPGAAGESLQHIAVAARQAQLDIGRLAQLLADHGSEDEMRTLSGLDALVRGAAATGLDVRCRVAGAAESLPGEVATTIFRLAQEGITNALKYAPGAAVDVSVEIAQKTVRAAVSNGQSRRSESGLEALGGGHGIAGLRDRVAKLGGTVRAEANATGGWTLEAEMPRDGLLP